MAKIESRLYDTSFKSTLARGNVGVRAAALQNEKEKKAVAEKMPAYQPKKAGYAQTQE